MPRKSYREYHADIYPDTNSTQPGMGPQNWLEGANVAPVKLSLNPAKRPETLTQFGPALADIPRNIAPPANQKTETSTNQRQANGVSTNQRPANGISTNGSSVHSGNGQMSPKPSPRHRVVRCNSEAGAGQLSSAPRPAPRPVSVSVSGNTQLSLVVSR